jgi:hypothetical protein
MLEIAKTPQQKEQDMSDLDDTTTTGPGEADQRNPLATYSLRRRRGVVVTSAAAIALGLAVVGGGVAGATSSATVPTPSGKPPSGARPPMGGSPPVAMGTVASVGDGTFTVTTKNKTTVTVTVSSTTTYRDPSVSAPTIADVTVGQHVAVFGTTTAKVVTATSVAIGQPPGRGKGAPNNRPPGGTRPLGGGSGSSANAASG